MADRWIVIPNWEKFQHRDAARSSVPTWIKFYTQLMSKDEFLELTFHQRGVLVSIWLEYATSKRQLRDNTLTLTRRLGHRVLTRDIETLVQAGLLELSASKPASAPASLEVEVDIEKTLTYNGSKTTTKPPSRPMACPECGLEVKSQRRLAEHLEFVHLTVEGDPVVTATAAEEFPF